jgi:hypothetical protein
VTHGIYHNIGVVPIFDIEQVVVKAVPRERLYEIFLGFLEVVPEVLLVKGLQGPMRDEGASSFGQTPF